MRLRSGRRLFSPVAAPRNDRLSSLPLDMQLEILARLQCARGAARTCVVSRQWLGIWTQLPELSFNEAVDPDKLAGVLSRLGALTARPRLRRLCIHLPAGNLNLGDARNSALRRAIAELAPSELVVTHAVDPAADARAAQEAGPRRSQRAGKANPKYFGDEWVQV